MRPGAVDVIAGRRVLGGGAMGVTPVYDQRHAASVPSEAVLRTDRAHRHRIG
jgi:hypothetical protein